MPSQHAVLSASGSNKWIHCHPSAREERTRVCLLEIWCEVLNGSKNKFTPVDQRELKAIMESIGWVRTKNPLRFGGIYGRQKAYVPPQEAYLYSQ